jgi:hypothetical protein
MITPGDIEATIAAPLERIARESEEISTALRSTEISLRFVASAAAP